MAVDLRFEVKLVAPETHLPRLRALLRLHPHGFRTLYPPRWINNVYFDSPDYSRLNQNYAGVSNRCKARLRWYGESWVIEDGVFEFKHKLAQLGYKRLHRTRGVLDLSDIRWSELTRYLHAQLPVSDWVEIRNLVRAVLINRYQREYYISANGAIRLTVDRNQRFYSQRSPIQPNVSFEAPRLNELVVELKASHIHRDLVQDALQNLPLRVFRNSKYVNGMRVTTGM